MSKLYNIKEYSCMGVTSYKVYVRWKLFGFIGVRWISSDTLEWIEGGYDPDAYPDRYFKSVFEAENYILEKMNKNKIRKIIIRVNNKRKNYASTNKK